MDFMKAFDQTVREIKREVNLKVLKVPEIEQKVLDATSDEPWGPHGSALSEIAHQTKKFTECQQIMSVLWARLADSGANWRHVYKAVAVIEYLVANGSERAVDDIIEHTFQITVLSGFEYVEPNGKDMGINVRKKVETILGLLNDREKIKAVRDKAAATRDKFFGISSSGITFKSSSASYGSSIHNSGYGGFSGSREGDTFRSKYTDDDVSKESHETHTSHNARNKYAKGIAHNERETKPHAAPSSGEPGDEDDFDDFNPRGFSTDGSTTANSTKLDLFGDNLIDITDDPPSTSNDSSRNVAASVVDLFEDATFVSAPVCGRVPVDSCTQENVDLFASQTAAPAAFPSQVDLFGTSNSAPTATKTLQSEPINTPSVDPFSTIPLTTFEGSDLLGGLTSNSNSKPEPPQNSESDLFGDFTSNSNPVNSQSSQDSGSDLFGDFTSNNNSLKLQPSQDTGSDPFGDFESNSKTLKSASSQNSIGDMSQPATTSATQSKQKSNFQVKSGIWADSLSRGIIDLNISAHELHTFLLVVVILYRKSIALSSDEIKVQDTRLNLAKKISLVDVGVVGSLDDAFEGKGKNQSTSAFMGRSIGTGTGLAALAKSTIPYSTGSIGSFSNLDPHQQFGSFK